MQLATMTPYISCTGPFYCAGGVLATALNSCTVLPTLINVPGLIDLTRTDAALGYIDPTYFLEDTRVFLISGTKDTVVVPG